MKKLLIALISTLVFFNISFAEQDIYRAAVMMATSKCNAKYRSCMEKVWNIDKDFIKCGKDQNECVDTETIKALNKLLLISKSQKDK